MAADLQDRLLSISKASETLGISPRGTRRLLELGILERVQIGGSVRVRLSDVAVLVADGVDLPSLDPAWSPQSIADADHRSGVDDAELTAPPAG